MSGLVKKRKISHRDANCVSPGDEKLKASGLQDGGFANEHDVIARGAVDRKAKVAVTKRDVGVAEEEKEEEDEEDEVNSDKRNALKDKPEPRQKDGEEIITKLPQDDDPKKSFKDLGIMDSLCEACKNLNYKYPTPIQESAIPIALAGRDIIGLAETGSGKTAAFVLPILQALWDHPQPFFACILAPTRELAVQISDAIEALGGGIGVKCATIVGGMEMVPQAIALGKRPHIIVATPGRLLDHLENTKGFSFRTLKYLVMDEADKLLDLDFGPAIDKLLLAIPKEGRHTYLFSATMTTKVEKLQRASLSNPVRLNISSSKYTTVKTLLQYYMLIPFKHKDIYLVYLCNEFAGQTIIIFTRTVSETNRLSILLRILGFNSVPLHGKLSQSNRLGALNKFKSGSRNILVATDVAARGLDIPSVDLVLNFDAAQDSKTYIHRVGRTARAGRSGKSITFVTQYDVEIFMRTEKALGFNLPEFQFEKEDVLLLSERVIEAQREAAREVRENGISGGRKGGGSRVGGRENLKGKGKGQGKRRRNDDMDLEER